MRESAEEEEEQEDKSMLLCTQGVMSTNDFFAAQQLEIHPSSSGGSPMASAPPATESGGLRSSCSPLATTAGTGEDGDNKMWPTCALSLSLIALRTPFPYPSLRRVSKEGSRSPPRFASRFTSRLAKLMHHVNEARHYLAGGGCLAVAPNGLLWCAGFVVSLGNGLGFDRGNSGGSNVSGCLPRAA